MAMYQCSICGCVENTSYSNYWNNPHAKLCSECELGKWHGQFNKVLAIGLLLGNDGFLYSDKTFEGKADIEWRKEHYNLKIIRRIE